MPANHTTAVPEPYIKLIGRFWLRPIRSKDELHQAIAVLDDLIMRDDLTEAEEDYLDVLTDLVEAYENEHVKLRPIHGVELVKGILEDRGLSQADVARGAGIATTTFNDILLGRRKLNLKHINALATYFKVSPAVFLPEEGSQADEPDSD